MEIKPRFRNILVPTDFSDGAARALRLAIDVARTSKGSITLVHVGLSAALASTAVGPPEAYIQPWILDRRDELAREQKHSLERLAHEEIPEDVPWRIVMREGFTPAEIVSEANEGAYDLVVMGTHGRTGLDRVLLGSVTERVLRSSTVPVLVTR